MSKTSISVFTRYVQLYIYIYTYIYISLSLSLYLYIYIYIFQQGLGAPNRVRQEPQNRGPIGGLKIAKTSVGCRARAMPFCGHFGFILQNLGIRNRKNLGGRSSRAIFRLLGVLGCILRVWIADLWQCSENHGKRSVWGLLQRPALKGQRRPKPFKHHKSSQVKSLFEFFSRLECLGHCFCRRSVLCGRVGGPSWRALGPAFGILITGLMDGCMREWIGTAEGMDRWVTGWT